MARYIDANRLNAVMNETLERLKTRPLFSLQDVHLKTAFQTLTDMINNAPTIDAVPVVHGKWIYEGARGRFTACRCSVCGNVENADWVMISGEVNYCPHCGAKMDGEDDEMPDL